MEYKIINNGQYLLVVSDENYKSDVFPYLVAERLTTNEFHLWQVDNENDWDDKNQYEILAHLPLKDSPALQGVDLLPPLKQEDDVEKLVEEYKNIGKEAGLTHKEYTLEQIGFRNGYNKAKEKYEYTKEDMVRFGRVCVYNILDVTKSDDEETTIKKAMEWINQQKLPKV